MSDAKFNKAVEIVRSPAQGDFKPTQDQQLEYYGLFKQATEGDNTGPAPGMFNITGKYKYNAWKKLEGKSKDEAKAGYIALLKSGLEAAAAGDDEHSKKLLEELEATA